MERPVRFASGNLKLEGLFAPGEEADGVVITHPHSLYGGDMENPVVAAIARAYGEVGYTTLRFNFRGVGESEGFYDRGAGEQKDVLSAVEYLQAQGIERIELAGYSFGAWVIAHLGSVPEIGCMTLISPPADFMDFDPALSLPCLDLVVVGSSDELGTPETVKKLMPGWNRSARLEIMSGADHFFSVHLQKLERFLVEYLVGRRRKP